MSLSTHQVAGVWPPSCISVAVAVVWRSELCYKQLLLIVISTFSQTLKQAPGPVAQNPIKIWYPVLQPILLARCLIVFEEDPFRFVSFRFVSFRFDSFRFVSIRFVSEQRKTSSAVEMASLILWLQAKEFRLSVCLNPFRKFSRS